MIELTARTELRRACSSRETTPLKRDRYDLLSPVGSGLRVATRVMAPREELLFLETGSYLTVRTVRRKTGGKEEISETVSRKLREVGSAQS
jgi:hypothetical protein